MIVGNLEKEKLIDIWRGQILTHYREKLRNGNRGKLLLCSTCDAKSEDDNTAYENDYNYF